MPVAEAAVYALPRYTRDSTVYAGRAVETRIPTTVAGRRLAPHTELPLKRLKRAARRDPSLAAAATIPYAARARSKWKTTIVSPTEATADIV